jgi:hypothetical protein
VLTLEEVRAEYDRMLRRLAALIDPRLGIACARAHVGRASGRVPALSARRRASGLLRVVGATRRQVAALFGLEAGVLAGGATAAALIAGAGLGHLQVAIFLRGMLGMSVLYAYPRGVAGAGAAAFVAAGVAAGWATGRHAGRAALGDVLRIE